MIANKDDNAYLSNSEGYIRINLQSDRVRGLPDSRRGPNKLHQVGRKMLLINSYIFFHEIQCLQYYETRTRAFTFMPEPISCIPDQLDTSYKKCYLCGFILKIERMKEILKSKSCSLLPFLT